MIRERLRRVLVYLVLAYLHVATRALLVGGVIATLLACQSPTIEPGPRAQQLAALLSESELKRDLLACKVGKFARTDFSIAHRGAPLGYAEHTREGYQAAAKMGAGLIECDVTFTKDLNLVCRHSQCDLHRTTNVLLTPLAERCSAPFAAATQAADATAQCCTSDFTLDEFKSLCGRSDSVDPRATTPAAYLADLTSPISDQINHCGTLLTHQESIELIDSLGADFVPELKAAQVEMPFNGLSQEAYASKLLNEYVEFNIDPKRVHAQSFIADDILYWIKNHPEFAEQAIYLDPRGRNPNFVPSLPAMQDLYAQGIRVLAPPMPMLLKLDPSGELVASDYAKLAKQVGLKLITWTFESRNPTSPSNWLYGNLPGFVTHEGQTLLVLHALVEKAGVAGIFSDWAGTVSYYQNCIQGESGGSAHVSPSKKDSISS